MIVYTGPVFDMRSKQFGDIADRPSQPFDERRAGKNTRGLFL